MDVTLNHTIYRFPILKNAEIIDCLSEAGIELNESELMEPQRHKEKVKQVFLSLVSLDVVRSCSLIRVGRKRVHRQHKEELRMNKCFLDK